MPDINTIINTCYQTQHTIQNLVGYSHLIPLISSIILGIFVYIKTNRDFFSKIFLAFIIALSIWLLGDYITWSSLNYNLVYATWSFLLYTEIVFYTLGLYFALVFVKKTDISIYSKILLFIGTLLPLVMTLMGQSVIGFDQPWCEAYNNDFLDQYKLAYEGVILSIILLHAIAPFFKEFSWAKIRANMAVLGSMFLFLSIFAITEYVAATTGNYELNLYSLFLLPVFLVAIIYAVFELDIFNVKILGTHYLVIGLVILMGGQLFFITDNANRLLTIIAMIIAVILSIILFKNLKKESDQRVQIEKLNIELQSSIQQRESLVHLVTHKVKGAFTRTKYIFAGMLDGTFGEISPEVKKRAQQGLESDDTGIRTVDLVLNASNLQKGAVKYEMTQFDLKDLASKALTEKKIQAESEDLKIENDLKADACLVLGDAFWLKEAINNLLENSIKYTKKGKITVGLEKKDGKVIFSVKDTGMGISDEDKKNLFTEGGRGKESVKVNVDSTGYGLYSVKLIINAHSGRVWAESEGPGKGSTFFIELSAI